MGFSTEYIYRILDKYSTPLGRITRSTDKFKASALRAATSVKRMNKNLAVMGPRMRSMGRATFAKVTLPIIGLGLAAGKTAIDMQSGFIGVRKTVDASAKTLEDMREEFKMMSKEIPVSVNELFRIGEAAGQLGIQTKNITAFAKTIAMLSATTNMGDEGATQLARFANITQMSQGNFDRLGSTIVHLGNKMATTEAEITGMALRLAASGNVVKMSEHQILALAAAATSVGLNAEAGGTAFSRVMLKINDAVDKNGAMLKKFASVSGKSAEDFAKKFKTDAAGAIIDFTEGLSRLSDKGANVSGILAKLGMADMRVRDSLLRAAGSGDVFRKALELGSVAWRENTALVKEAELRFGSWASKLKVAWNRIKLIANEVGKILVPALIKFLDIMIPILESFNGLSRMSKIVIISLTAIAAVIPPLLIAVGSLGVAMAGLSSVAGVAFIATVSAIAVPFLAVAAAIGTVTAATYQLTKHWDALTAPGFLKDLAGWGKEVLFGGGDAVARSLTDPKARARAAQNNKVEVTGGINVTASGGAKVKRADINLNSGYNLAGVGA